MTIEYIAGFFDGEGTIQIATKGKFRVSIPQTNLEILEEIRDFFKVGKIFKEKKRKAHWKDSWVYYTGNNEETWKVLELLKSHLIIKKEKCLEAISLLTIRKKELDKKEVLHSSIPQLIELGMSYRQIEEEFGIGRQTVCNYMKKVYGAAWCGHSPVKGGKQMESLSI